MPEGWATAEAISAYQPSESSKPLYPGSKILSVNPSGELALVGGTDGAVDVYSLPQKDVIHTLQTDGPVTDAVWASEKPVICSSTGSVNVFENGNKVAGFSTHAGAATALAIHPTGDIVASAGTDKSYVLYDLTTNSVITQIFSDACKAPCDLVGGVWLIFCSSSTIGQVPSRRPPCCSGGCRWTDQDFRHQNRHSGRKLHDVRSSQVPVLLGEWDVLGSGGGGLHDGFCVGPP